MPLTDQRLPLFRWLARQAVGIGDRIHDRLFMVTATFSFNEHTKRLESLHVFFESRKK